eukprot:6468982-Amphidinium_carterae.1
MHWAQPRFSETSSHWLYAHGEYFTNKASVPKRASGAVSDTYANLESRSSKLHETDFLPPRFTPHCVVNRCHCNTVLRSQFELSGHDS